MTPSRAKYSYLHQTTNEILQIQRSAMKLTPVETKRVAISVCKTLEALLRDPSFKKDLHGLADLSKEHSEYHRQLADDLVLFLGSFVPEEMEILRKTELSLESTSQMLAAAGSLRGSLREPMSPEQLLDNVNRLRIEACAAADTMERTQDDEKSRKQRWKIVWRWGLGLGGLSLVAADSLAAVPSGGIATASFTLGGAAVGAAVTLQ